MKKSFSYPIKNQHELKFCFWNVGGLGDKIYDKLFLEEIKHFDLIFLAETHVGYNTCIAVEGYHYFPVCRSVSSNGRYFGGLGILTKMEIRPYVKILQNKSKEYQWVKLEKDFFNLKNDLYICLAYIPPVNSSYSKNITTDILDNIERDVDIYNCKGDIMLCGDFNARTGTLADFIENDSLDHIPMYEGYKPDFCEIKRNSRDKYVDSRGKELIEMCIEKQVRILNGRSLGDINGKYTCLTSNGSSVVDYVLVSHSILNKILYFEVSDFLPTLSDCHCKLSWGLLTNFNVPIQETYKKKFPDKYIWDEKSSELFQEAMLSVEIQDKINSFFTL